MLAFEVITLLIGLVVPIVSAAVEKDATDKANAENKKTSDKALKYQDLTFTLNLEMAIPASIKPL